MGCESRAVLLIFLFGQLLSTANNTAHNEDGVRQISMENEKWHQSGIAIIKIIRIIMEPIADMQKGHDNDFLLRVFNLFGDVISELTQLADFNVTQPFRRLVLRNIDRAKKELASAAKNIEWASEVVNNSLSDHIDDSNQWQTKVNENQRFLQKYRTACHVVDDLITLSSIQLHKCCNVTMKPTISLCRSFRILLANSSRYMAYMARVLNHLHVCLEINSFHSEYTIRCIDFFYNEITNLIQDADHIIRKLIGLLRLKILYSKCCISLALVEKNEKNKHVIAY